MNRRIFESVAELNRELASRPHDKIVFTNGVFDLLHGGHIDLLEFARGCGDALVLGINDDASVRRLKGPERPIHPLRDRMELLAEIEFVDYIIPFSEDTPLELIKNLQRVDVLVKGGDYRPHEVVGRDIVEASGGTLRLFDFQTHASTTAIVEKIRRAAAGK